VSSDTLVPCSALVFAQKMLFEMKFYPDKKLGLSPGFNFRGRSPFAGLPVPMKNNPG